MQSRELLCQLISSSPPPSLSPQPFPPPSQVVYLPLFPSLLPSKSMCLPEIPLWSCPLRTPLVPTSGSTQTSAEQSEYSLTPQSPFPWLASPVSWCLTLLCRSLPPARPWVLPSPLHHPSMHNHLPQLLLCLHFQEGEGSELSTAFLDEMNVTEEILWAPYFNKGFFFFWL